MPFGELSRLFQISSSEEGDASRVVNPECLLSISFCRLVTVSFGVSASVVCDLVVSRQALLSYLTFLKKPKEVFVRLSETKP